MDHQILDPESTIKDFSRWVYSRANAMLPPDTIHRGTAMDREDLAQVGLIALWKATTTCDESRGAAPAYLTRRAQGDMLDALRAREKHIVQGVPIAWDDPDSDPTPIAEALEDRMVMAYHRGEIAKALAELTPRQREYVVLRFWGDVRWQEINEHFGYEPRGLWRAARERLAQSLAHLADAV